MSGRIPLRKKSAQKIQDELNYSTLPIKVKVMLHYTSKLDYGHIGIKAWIPGTKYRYCIHFTDHRASTDDWSAIDNHFNADMDIEPCKRSFTFHSNLTLLQLETWHKNSNFYHREDWSLYNNCADGVINLMKDLFDIHIQQTRNGFKTPFSTCFWGSTGISLPRSVYAATEKALRDKHEINLQQTPVSF